jgi:hypothetical protein
MRNLWVVETILRQIVRMRLLRGLYERICADLWVKNEWLSAWRPNRSQGATLNLNSSENWQFEGVRLCELVRQPRALLLTSSWMILWIGAMIGGLSTARIWPKVEPASLKFAKYLAQY